MWVSSMIARLALVTTLLISLPLVAGFLGALHPAFDSFSHFRIHLAVLLGLTGLLLLLSGWWTHGFAAVLLGAAAIASATGLGGFGIGAVHAAFQEARAGAPIYRLLHLNLRYDNSEPDKVIALIGSTKPDFVMLNEVSALWADKLRGLLNQYPYQLRCGRGSRIGGAAILSRAPFSPAVMSECSGDGALATAAVDLEGRTVALAALHLGWPWPSGQAGQVSRLSARLGALGPDAILTGDLNAVAWSRTARRVAAAGGLTPMQSPGPTWLFRQLPAALRPLIGLPIDHVFTKGAVVLHSGRALDEVGSDHLPILVEFSLPQAEQTGDTIVAKAL